MPATRLQQERRERLGIFQLALIECIRVVGLEISFDSTRFLLVAAGSGGVTGKIKHLRVERRELKIGEAFSGQQACLLLRFSGQGSDATRRRSSAVATGALAL